jgi:H+/gluconate symporter-like permease
MGAIAIIGLIVSLAFIIFAAYKGWHILPVSMLGGLIVLFTNGMNIWEGYATNYAKGMMTWVGGFYLIFALGALFGEFMGSSGAARSIAYKVADKIGAKYTPIAVALITLILTYGGVNAFVVTFAVMPLAVVLCKEANIPRAIVVGASTIGSGTATQTALPGTPSTQNLVPTQLLGTTIYAAPVIGIVCGVFMVVAGLIYIVWQQKRAAARGENFVAIPQDNLSEGAVRADVPNFGLSILPVIVVIALVFLTRNALPPMASVCFSLLIGCLLTLIVFWKRLPAKQTAINKGFASSIMPLLSTAAILGYGAIVQASPAFQNVVRFAQSLTLNPYITTAIGVNIIAGVSGSSSGGLRIYLESMGQFMLDKGVPPVALHRVAAIASGGLDTLPHNGAVIAAMMIWGSNHKESYKHICATSVIIPIFATVIAVILANILYPIK